MMLVSVIIPSYNGAHKLPNIIHSLQKQVYTSFEVIVVVDGSTDNTIEVLNSLKPQITSFKVVEQANMGRAKVRNNGARNANGSLLIFFDDDMVVSSNCIAEHVKHHQEYPGSILTGGLKEPNEGRNSDFSRFKAYLNKRWNADFKEEGTTLISKESPYLTAGNLSIAKELFFQLEGFDERLNDAEDYDMAMRAIRLYIPLYYREAAFTWHNDPVNCRKFIKRLRQYASAQQQLCRLKPELYNNSLRVVSIPKGMKGMAFQLFCFQWWIDSVDKGFWKWLPSNIRFKLYDLIITANGSFFTQKVTLGE